MATNWTSFSGSMTLKSYCPRGPRPMPPRLIRSFGATKPSRPSARAETKEGSVTSPAAVAVDLKKSLREKPLFCARGFMRDLFVEGILRMPCRQALLAPGSTRRIIAVVKQSYPRARSAAFRLHKCPTVTVSILVAEQEFGHCCSLKAALLWKTKRASGRPDAL